MKFDILKIIENSTTVKTEGSQITSHRKSEIIRHGVRRFENQKVFQTSRLGEANQDRLIADTKEFGGLGTIHDYGFAPEASEHRTSHSVDSSALTSYTEALSYLNAKYPDYIFSGQCSVTNKTLSLSSNYGVDLSTQSGLVDWYFLFQKKGSGNMMDGFLYGSSPKDSILQSVQAQEDYLKIGDKIEKIQSGKYPVLLVEEKSPLKKLLESFHLNKYSDSSALYSGKLKSKLFSDKVTIFDSGYDPAHAQFSFFDGEGVVRSTDLKLIDAGIFTSTISDLRFSKKYAGQSTGNGLRVYNRGVNVDFKNLRIKKGLRPWKEIISHLPVCIVAAVTAGGDSNDLGEFSSPVQIGYVYRFGELVGLAPQITIKTSIEQYLDKNLIDISSDGFTEDHSSGCVISEMDVLLNS